MSNLLKAVSKLIVSHDNESKSDDDDSGKTGKGLCLIYALNAVIGNDKYSKQQLDAIQYQVSPQEFEQRKKEGHYDANVLMIALQNEGISTTFYDVRNAKLFQVTEEFIGHDLAGFIVNFQKGKFKVFSGRSWKCIKRDDNVWFDFDRKLEKPKALGTDKQVTQYLVTLMTKHAAQLIICRWNL